MYVLQTENFDLIKLYKKNRVVGDIIISFCYWDGPLQNIPVFSIFDDASNKGIILRKINNIRWQILHCEVNGEAREFLEEDYQTLKNFSIELQKLNSSFNIKAGLINN